jgi:hypothetical protein
MRQIVVEERALPVHRARNNHPMLFPICEDGKWGYIDAAGTVIVPPSLTYAHEFSEGVGLVEFDGGDSDADLGFIDAEGNLVIGPEPPNHLDIPHYWKKQWGYRDFHEACAGFWIGDVSGRGGYIDTNGQIAIPPKYQQISDFQEGLACVAVARNDASPFGSLPTGFINHEDEFVISPKHDFLAAGFSNGLCRFTITDEQGHLKSGFIDRTGDIVVPPIYCGTEDFSEGRGRVGLTQHGRRLFGYVGTEGGIAIPLEYEWASRFGDERAFVAKSGRAYLIDVFGTVVVDLDFDPRTQTVKAFSEGLAAVLPAKGCSGKCGFIDTHGSLIVTPKFCRVRAFSGGLARVSSGDITGYINRQGDFIWATDRWGDW